MVLGHTQCGAVTAVTHALHGSVISAIESQTRLDDSKKKGIADMAAVQRQEALIRHLNAAEVYSLKLSRANAEESASAAEEMSAQAEQLKEYVEDLFVLVTGKKKQSAAVQKHPVLIPAEGQRRGQFCLMWKDPKQSPRVP